MLNPYLPVGLETTAMLLESEAARVTADRYDHRPDPDRFSFREVIAHIADWEPIMLSRIRAGVDAPGSTIEAFDEVQWAKDHDYAHQDPEESMQRFLKDRRATLEYVRAISREKMANTVIHPERGVMSVADIAHMIVCHDLYHVVQLKTM
jgi:uncharacterized damage-inducible protein DinB